jgi:hypothetical protein
MNCNCINELEKKILEAHPEYKGKKVTHVNMDKIFTLNPTGIRTSTNVSIEVEGQKKKYNVGMAHTYCPFCGVKQVKEE